MSFIDELNRRHVFKVAAAYAVVAWVLIQVASVISRPMSLPEWFEPVFLTFLILGFPIALVLAWAFDLNPSDNPASGSSASGSDVGRQRSVANTVLAVTALVAVGASGWWLAGADERRARSGGIAELDAFIASGDWEGAYHSAVELNNVIPGDSELAGRWSKFSWRTTLESSPPGARIYRRPYRDSDDWQLLGATPLVDIRVPFGFSVLRAELEGHDPVLQVIGGHLHLTETLTNDKWQSKIFDLAPELMHLDPTGTLPEGMVRVLGWRQEIDDKSFSLNDYFLGRYEVSNLEFKEFVDAGGYERQEYWVHPIESDGNELAWNNAISGFVDTTGRLGPSTWIAGDFPADKAEHPVSGISWYEAAAYARFRGLQLPTAHHWRRAYASGAFAAMLPESNLVSGATVPVGSTGSISWAGNFDLAGNVREWVSNADGNRRYALGGAWNDSGYRATDDGSLTTDRMFSQSPLNRQAGNGLRLALVRDEPAAIAAALVPVSSRELRDITAAGQVSDEVFDAYRINFEYDRTPLNAAVEAINSDRLMTHELVEIDAAYSSLRLPIHLYLPTASSPPYQVVLYGPGGIVTELERFEDFKFQFDFLLKSGRAVAFPIYYDTFGRRETVAAVEYTGTAASRDAKIRAIKDLRRTVDYLETRPDIDTQKFAYFGNSWGARTGAITLALEPRFRASVLYTLPTREESQADIDPVSYLKRIRTPVLMISGEYDPMVPLDEARPAFDLIDSAPGDKRMIVAPSGHFAPYDLLVRESLAWYDEKLGTPGKR
jgi:dienelactone hydrolase